MPYQYSNCGSTSIRGITMKVRKGGQCERCGRWKANAKESTGYSRDCRYGEYAREILSRVVIPGFGVSEESFCEHDWAEMEIYAVAGRKANIHPAEPDKGGA